MSSLTTIDALVKTINTGLSDNLRPATSDPSQLIVAMDYSLTAGGKRLRPALTMRTIEALTRKTPWRENNQLLKLILAVELIHTYSLIHDDLPAMDNDDLRRGNLTNHKKFGEALAILAGDGLLTLAFEWVVDNQLDSEVVRQVSLKLAQLSGPTGMVGGQAIDVQNEGHHLSYEQVKVLHAKKTGALIEYATQVGGIIVGADAAVNKLLVEFGKNFGLAFQIYDDLMDQIGTVESMGKSVHKDDQEQKNTYPALFGIDGTKQKLKVAIEAMQQNLNALSKISTIQTDDFDDFLAYFKI